MIGITSKEQSERLIVAGLDPLSGDMVYQRLLSREHVLCIYGHTYPEHDLRVFKTGDAIPAWSIGGLWQILNENGIWFYEYATSDSVEKVLESLVSAVERAVKSGSIKNTELL